MAHQPESFRQLEWTQDRVDQLIRAGKTVSPSEDDYRSFVREHLGTLAVQYDEQELVNEMTFALSERDRLDTLWGYPAQRPFSRMLSATKVPHGRG